MAFNQSKNKDLRKLRNIVIQQNNMKYIIKQSQQYMTALTENLGSIEPFDNSVVPDDCIDRLVAHRIKTKFHVSDLSASKLLQDAAFSKYIHYDGSLLTDVKILPFSPLSRARSFLHTWFKDWSVDYSAIRYTVSPGETYISSGGEVSILAKLFDKKHWTTTANCLDDTCVFIYNNASFKRAARQHFSDVATRKYRRKLFLRYKHLPDTGFRIFRHLLINHVLTVVDGARASSVPKSNDARRFINVEAMFPVILQRAAADGILSVLARQGNDLGNTRLFLKRDLTGAFVSELSAQGLHGRLIKDSRFSTIDFSNASDSVTTAAVIALFPKQVSDTLIRLRSHFVVIDDHFHSPLKLSSMGNGFTFEVMTAMLFAVAKSFSDDVRVYGDDVIIPSVYAHQFVDTCKLIDFRVNEKKTFINSFFRESCGYFYSDHIRDYIVSFDFNSIECFSDVIISCNKLTTIISAGQISHDLRDKLELTRDRLSALAHASRKGPLPSSLAQQRRYLALYIFDEGYEKKQKRSKELRSLRQHYIEKNGWYFDGVQVPRNSTTFIYVPFFVPERSKHVFANMRGMEILLPALYSGKRLKAACKGKGRWIDLPAFVSNDGTLTLISNLIASEKIWVDRLEGVFDTHIKK